MHTPPTSRSATWAWVVWSVGLAGYTLAVVNRTSLASVGVDAAERFTADAATLSMFAVVQLAVYGGMQIPIGVMLDRWGARPILVVGMAVMAAGQLTMALSPSVGVAIFARMLIGAGDAAIFPGVLRLVATWFPAQRAPIMVQLTGLIGQLGQLVALIPLASLLHATSWEIAFGSLAGLCILFAALIFALVRNRPPEVTQDVSVNTETGVVRVVTSSIDTGVGVRAAWAHPGTRLAFWSHFVTPFSGAAFMLLWGMPFLTAGQGLTQGQAAAVTSTYVLGGAALGLVIGDLSRRLPMHRSFALVLPAAGIQMLAWVVVCMWPGPAPFWLLIALALALAVGGPASMVAFDHARTHNPAHRLSTATGLTNVGGFFAALIAVFFIGLAMDMQGAGTPARYTLEAFQWAFLTQVPLWVLGIFMILIERRNTRRHLGLIAPRTPR